MKILVATDGSEFNLDAVRQSCRIVAEENSAIKIVSVIQEVVPLDAFAQSAQYAESEEQKDYRQSKEYVEQAAQFATENFSDAGVEITTRVLKGAVDEAVMTEARDWSADLIVVGSHGRGFLRAQICRLAL